ncbi:MAG: hypothetical protein JXB07_17155 [Anaerolineae bacterium]|nr:hypothetical protein [Anaerolineae bacterium]
MALQIDILYTADCTDWETAVEIVQQVLVDLNLEAEFQYWLIENDRQAIEAYFTGSPTIRVNGEELFPVPGAIAGLRLRSYWTEEGMLGYPTYNMVYEALSQYVV